MKDPIQPERIDLLAKKWQEGTISDEEKKEFETWYADFDEHVEVDSLESSEQAGARYYRQIAARVGIRPVKTAALWPRIAAVAAAVAVIVFGVYLFKGPSIPVTTGQVVSVFGGDVAPGKNSAVLTLASGRKITLSDAKSGVVIDAASGIAYSDGSKVLPGDAAGVAAAELATISTPAGGKYNVTLPDGTKVALNAASTLSFPSSFLGLVNRRVELRGEGYFAVAKDKLHPFLVQTDRQLVEVLGTHFNVNAYPDESATVTTLEEGSVKVTAGGRGEVARLVPGEQSLLSDGALKVSAADLEENLAWKNGDFVFNDEGIEDVMRRVSRWYDVEVVYVNGVPSGTYYAKVSRSKNISQVLRALELTKLVHFKVEGRRILVTK